MDDTESGRRVRAGVVGASGIGQVHVDALRRIGIEVTAVAGSTLPSARRAADQFNVASAYDNVEDLVQDPAVEVVHVCTPNALHVDHVGLALDAGRHVVCEKPLATNRTDAEVMVRRAEEAGLVHAVVYNYRYNAVVQALCKKVAAGELGRLHLIHGTYLAEFALLEDEGSSWIFDSELMGPGFALTDIGVHWWDLAEQVSGSEANSVLCTAQTTRPGGGDREDSVAVQMRLQSGAVASAVISSAAPGRDNGIRIEATGTTASASWEQEDPDHLTIQPLRGPTQIWARPVEVGPNDERLVIAPRGHPHGYLDSFRELFARIYGRIEGIGSVGSYPTFDDGLRGVAVLEAMLASKASGNWVDVPA